MTERERESELDSDTWSKLMSFEVTVYKIQVWYIA